MPRLTFIALILLTLAQYPAHAFEPIIKVVEAKYSDVRNDIEDAIRNKGLNIANVLHASDMLGRTGPDFGYDIKIYDRAEIFEFCSAKISHKLSQSGHGNILACPFKISIYNLTSEPKKVHIVYSKISPPDKESKEAVNLANQLVQAIIEEATAW